MTQGFIRVAAAIPSVKVADCQYNISKIIELAEKAEREHVEIVSFPELSITGYTCGDLFYNQQLLDEAEQALHDLLLQSFHLQTVMIVGMPWRYGNSLYNVAVIMQSGKILGIIPKSYMANNSGLNESRWFKSAIALQTTTVNFRGADINFGANQLFTHKNTAFAIEICKDVWVSNPPSTQHSQYGADIIFNLSTSAESTGKRNYLKQILRTQSAKCSIGYVYASSGFGESSTDFVYAGHAFIIENGRIIAENKRFSLDPQLVISEIDIDKIKSEKRKNDSILPFAQSVSYVKTPFHLQENTWTDLYKTVDKYPFIPSKSQAGERYFEAFSMQIGGLAKRWTHTQAQHLIIGISGGLDSTLALLVCVATADKLAYDRKRIVGITMPGFGTTNRTYNNAYQLMQALGITIREISIKDACIQHFKDIEHDINQHDITYENAQARERTQVLMDVANQMNGLVIGTGNLSESALGWSTYNGDHMSMYAVNAGVPKTLVRELTHWVANQMNKEVQEVIFDILKTPISPELLPTDKTQTSTQVTEDVIGPYELHDFFIYYFVRFGFSADKIFYLANQAFKGDYEAETIAKWLKIFLKRFISQQFKRSCMPDAPKVGSVSFSPRGDWKMPSDASAFKWEKP